MKLTFRTYSAHPDYGTVLPGGSADVPERLVKDLIDGGYVIDPNPKPATTQDVRQELRATGASAVDESKTDTSSGEESPPESAALLGGESAALFGGETAMQPAPNPKRRGKAD